MNIRRATWLELFFDLVFVAVIGVMAHDLAHTDHGEIHSEQIVSFFLVVVPVLWVWGEIYAVRQPLRRRPCVATLHRHRRDGPGAAAAAVPPQHVQGGGYPGFVVTYLAMQAIPAVAYFTAPQTTPAGDCAGAAGRAGHLVGAAISATSLLFATHWKFVLLYAGIVVQLLLMARLNGLARIPGIAGT